MAKKGIPSLLSALEKTAENASAVNTELVRELRLSDLEDNPMNRFSMEEDAAFEATLASIGADGLLEDIIVTPAGAPGKYRIVSGHRRVLAAKKLGKATLPCKIRSYPDRLAELRALMGANLYRRTVSPFDMAAQLETLREVLRQEGRLPEAVKEQSALMAEQTRLSRATVERYLDLLNLDETLAGWARAGRMTMTDAYALGRRSARPLYAAVEAYVEAAPEARRTPERFPALVHEAVLRARAASEAPEPEREDEGERGSGDAAALRKLDTLGRTIRRQSAAVDGLRFGDAAARDAAKRKLDACLGSLDGLRRDIEALRRELD